MKLCSLLFLRRDGEILLAMKKRGFGAGRWNGVGGKVEPDETVEQAAVRECQEEIGVTPRIITKSAVLDFHFPGGTPDIQTHTFICTDWEGTPTETDEMAPQWFSLDRIPYGDMWQDDSVWLPVMLRGQQIVCSFRFDEHDTMLSARLDIVPNLHET